MNTVLISRLKKEADVWVEHYKRHPGDANFIKHHFETALYFEDPETIATAKQILACALESVL